MFVIMQMFDGKKHYFVGQRRRPTPNPQEYPETLWLTDECLAVPFPTKKQASDMAKVLGEGAPEEVPSHRALAAWLRERAAEMEIDRESMREEEGFDFVEAVEALARMLDRGRK